MKWVRFNPIYTHEPKYIHIYMYRVYGYWSMYICIYIFIHVNQLWYVRVEMKRERHIHTDMAIYIYVYIYIYTLTYTFVHITLCLVSHFVSNDVHTCVCIYLTYLMLYYNRYIYDAHAPYIYPVDIIADTLIHIPSIHPI